VHLSITTEYLTRNSLLVANTSRVKETISDLEAFAWQVPLILATG